MAELILDAGVDTWVVQPYPDTTRDVAKYPVIQNSLRRTLVQINGLDRLPSTAVILSATLSCPARGAWDPQLVSVQALGLNADGSQWRVARATWNNQPGVVGSAVATSISALDDGDAVDLDVTALAQAIVLGQANYGWRIFTDNAATQSSFYGFDSGHESWTLMVEYTLSPEAPAQLTPQGVVGIAKPVFQVDDQDDLAQMRVQIDDDMLGTPLYDSGWGGVTGPALDSARTDLPGGAYSGLADGMMRYWRVAVKTTDGAESDFSEWVQITRDVKPTLAVDSPTGGTTRSSTPTVTAHLSPAGTADTRWRVRVLAATTPDVLWDSGTALQGATLTAKVPRKWRGKTVLAEDVSYRFEVSVLDRPDRVGSYGDPQWITSTQTVLLDHDASEAIPSGLVASQPTVGAPDVLLHFTRSATPDYFEVQRSEAGGNFKTLPYEINPADALYDALTWEWVDVTAPPNTTLTYRVRAVTNDNSSPWSVTDTLTPEVKGMWIRSGYGSIVLDGDTLDAIKQVTKRVTYNLPYAYEDVDIIGAVGGYAADSLDLSIDNRDPDYQSVDDAREILEEVRKHPEQPVQLVWGTVSIPAYLRDLSVAPASDSVSALRDRKHAVSFGFFQTDDAAETGYGAAYYDVGVYA
ncbi:DNRLRE domain-containing protein [Nocardioides montaniterrae]